MKKLTSFLRKHPVWTFSAGVFFALFVTVSSIAFLSSSASARIAVVPKDMGDNQGMLTYLYQVSYEVFYEIESRLYYPADTWACQDFVRKFAANGHKLDYDSMTKEEHFCASHSFSSRSNPFNKNRGSD